jgi:DNA-binding transcriptional LysR family regulator
MTKPDPWLGVEMRHLAALDAIASERSFSRAARKLGYTQSAVSQQLALLERIVGERLVERPGGPRPVSLAPAGEVLLRHARRVVDQLGAAQTDLAAWSAGRVGRLRVGTFHSVGARILPAVISRFAAEHPEVHVTLHEAADEGDLLGMVRRGDLDVTFMLLPALEGPFETTELFEDPFRLLLAADHPLALARADDDTARPPTLSEIARLPLIVYDNVRDVTRPEARLGHRSQIVFRSNSDQTIHGLVATGIGAAMLPRLSVDSGYPGLAWIDLRDRIPPRRIGLAWHADREPLPAARAFRALTEELCADFVARWNAGAPVPRGPVPAAAPEGP